VPIVWKYDWLKLLEPSVSVQGWNGIALPSVRTNSSTLDCQYSNEQKIIIIFFKKIAAYKNAIT
jgi:hypothetical protein